MSQELETLDDVEAETDLPLPEIEEVLKDRYRIIALLGRGGSSKVFEAEHVELGLRYAVKFLRSERAGAARTRQRFAQEARLLAGLDHPGIARVVDIGYYKGVTPFIALEHVAGETLRTRMRKQRTSLAQALELMSQVCAAMSTAHDQGIVHRDLKPENLMITSRSEGTLRLRVLDFGIARTLAEDEPRLTPTGAQLGTPHYMAPEQARGDKQIGPAADVYGLGVVFYELLSQSRPHPGDSHYSVIFHLLTQDPVPLADVAPDVPRDVRDVVERCLRRKPEERYASARELGSAVAALCQVHSSSANALEARVLDVQVLDVQALDAPYLPSATGKSLLRSPWLSAFGGVVLGGSVASIAHDVRVQSAPTLLAEPITQATSAPVAQTAPPIPPLEENAGETAPPSAEVAPASSADERAADERAAERTVGEGAATPRATQSPRRESRPRPSAAAPSPPLAGATPSAAIPAQSTAVSDPSWGGIIRNPYD